ncbi:MAG TPA: hypothetical protein VFV99_24630 [Kofleriaceae bacterium]|nr:hypothetical protein [Kofleriaceae bacterium]
MANIASEPRPAIVARPAFVAAVMLAAFALVPWQHHGGTRRVIVPLDEIKRPPVIVPMELYAGPGVLADLVDLFAPAFDVAFDSVIEPAEHPDAQPWPRGMVIHPPPFPDQMNVMPSGLDRLLSGLLAPWHSIAS